MARWSVGELLEELQDMDPESNIYIYDAVKKQDYGFYVDAETEGDVKLVVSD